MIGILLMALVGGIIICTLLEWLWRFISHIMGWVGLFLVILAGMLVVFGYTYF